MEEKKPSRFWKLLQRLDEATFYAGLKFASIGFSLAYCINSRSEPGARMHSPLTFTLVGFAFGMGSAGYRQHTKVRSVIRHVDETNGVETIEEKGLVADKNTIPTLITHARPYPSGANDQQRNRGSETAMTVFKTLLCGYVAYLTAPVLILGGTIVVWATILAVFK